MILFLLMQYTSIYTEQCFFCSFLYIQKEEENTDLVKEDSKAVYFCNNGFKLKDSKDKEIYCRGGRWHGSIPVCGMFVHYTPESFLLLKPWVGQTDIVCYMLEETPYIYMSI